MEPLLDVSSSQGARRPGPDSAAPAAPVVALAAQQQVRLAPRLGL